jgi:phosphoribosylanthranilate isomerase
MIKVQVCGITNLKDALFCEETGIDAVGFVDVERSPRKIPLESTGEIVSKLGPLMTKVLICEPRSAEEAVDKAKKANVNVLQLHSLGAEEITKVKQAGFRVVRVIGIDVDTGEREADVEKYAEVCDALLFDASVRGVSGGTGRSYDYSRIPDFEGCSRVIIAGGITPENIRNALRMKPYGITVSSGVEGSVRGRKDHAKILRLMEEVREHG